MKKVSIIISNRNDLVMLSVTVVSCLEEISPYGDLGEVVICDNSDQEIYDQLKHFIPAKYVREGKVKILRQGFPCLFTARETSAQAAEGEYIICVDSHMILGHNMVKDLVDFMDRHKDDPTMGFAHAPINWAHRHFDSSRHDRVLTKSELGPWGKMYDHERTITWKGMPWICRREWFIDTDKGLCGYGALAQHRISWGGGDMHIGTKPWLLGFKNWAVPTRAAVHIGPYPNIDQDPKNKNVSKVANGTAYRYRLYNKSGTGPHTVGFLVACYVLGGEAMMKRNRPVIEERFGRYLKMDAWWERAKFWGKDERNWLLERQVMSFDEFIKTQPWNQSSDSRMVSAV